MEKSRQKFKAAPLTVEFVPFFYRKSGDILRMPTGNLFKLATNGHKLN